MSDSIQTITGKDVQKIRLDIGLRSERLADALGIDLTDQLEAERQGPDADYLRRLLMAHHAGDLPSAWLIHLTPRIEEVIKSYEFPKPPFTPTKERMRKARLLLRLSQADLAYLVGVTAPAICRMERGFVTPQEHTIQALADLLIERLKPQGDLDELLDAAHPTSLKRGPRSATKAPTLR